ncbi:MAG: response regulator [Rhodospirillaceae bacterium]|nr:response regulator [Rhodospirillales bacterium]MBT4700458.1 response regulator [Rhodospirillaceae bacterium]MBT5036532.1 response regulator [Rhodospirillaceae bacterium]MBT6220023.1 response regulator [Rhodospirillaceae bacterium]MBT6362562.1 response regulator [Rhodospirillaceae bacterium]
MNFVNTEQQPTEKNQLSKGLTVPSAADKAPGYLENLKFLIVDDNAFMRSIVKNVLNSLDARYFREAADGAEALKILQSGFTPDIAIVDWEMKPLDGIELVQMIRTAPDSANPFLPIIMLSGHSEVSRILQARDAGVNEFVVKPISVKSLFSRIDSLINKPRKFIRAGSFFGPDRRRRTIDVGISDRRGEAAPDQSQSLTTDQVSELLAQ